MGNEMDEWELVDELAECMAYCCAERENKEASVAWKSMVVKFYHEQWGRLPLPLQQFRVKAVKKGIKMAHAEVGNQARVRRPLT